MDISPQPIPFGCPQLSLLGWVSPFCPGTLLKSSAGAVGWRARCRPGHTIVSWSSQEALPSLSLPSGLSDCFKTHQNMPRPCKLGSCYYNVHFYKQRNRDSKGFINLPKGNQLSKPAWIPKFFWFQSSFSFPLLHVIPAFKDFLL